MTRRPPGLLVWLRELRAPFFVGTLTPVVVGAAYAHYRGAPFHWGDFLLTFLGIMLTNAGLNMANDYFDHKSGDDLLTKATPVSGGSKVIQEGLLAARAVLAAAVGCLAAAAAIGLYLNFRVGGWVILGTGLVGMLIAWGYSAPPLKLGHRSGVGELACVLGCGPVIGLGAFFVQAGRFSWAAVLATLPTGILMGLVLLLNEFHDREADGRVGKRTLVVAMGAKRATYLLVAGLLSAFGLIAGLVATGLLPVRALFVLATLPLAGFVAWRALRFHADTRRLLPANFAMIGLHVLFSATLAVMVLL
jgi:1,4-dihydroxy-2-naphthoate polyprenyltransferase